MHPEFTQNQDHDLPAHLVKTRIGLSISKELGSRFSIWSESYENYSRQSKNKQIRDMGSIMIDIFDIFSNYFDKDLLKTHLDEDDEEYYKYMEHMDNAKTYGQTMLNEVWQYLKFIREDALGYVFISVTDYFKTKFGLPDEEHPGVN